MNASVNKYDSLENLIYEEGLRIEAIDFHQETDLFLVILNTKATLRQNISLYPRLKDATGEQLRHYQLIGNGTGVHWPELDEDLSLKGFFKEQLKKLVGSNGGALAA